MLPPHRQRRSRDSGHDGLQSGPRSIRFARQASHDFAGPTTYRKLTKFLLYAKSRQGHSNAAGSTRSAPCSTPCRRHGMAERKQTWRKSGMPPLVPRHWLPSSDSSRRMAPSIRRPLRSSRSDTGTTSVFKKRRKLFIEPYAVSRSIPWPPKTRTLSGTQMHGSLCVCEFNLRTAAVCLP